MVVNRLSRRNGLPPTRLPQRALVSGVLLFCAAMPARLPAQKPSQHPPHKKVEREQVEKLEEQWRQAMLDDDVNAMDKLLSEDFLGVTAGGDLVTKSQQLDRMRNRQAMVTRLDVSDMKVKLIGQIAIVSSLSQVEATAIDGRPVAGEYRYTRVYQRLPNGAWKITSFEATRVSPGIRVGRRAPAEPTPPEAP